MNVHTNLRQSIDNEMDLGQGPGDLSPSLILEKKKKRNRGWKISRQGKQQKNCPLPPLAQDLDPPL